MATLQDRPMQRPVSRKSARAYWSWGLVAIALLLSLDIVTYFLAEGLWFRSVNYIEAFWLRLQTQLILGTVAFLGSLLFAGLNLWRAQQLSFDDYCIVPSQENRRRGIGLGQLLPITFSLALLLSVSVLYHGQLALTRWHYSTVEPLPPLPLWFNIDTIWRIFQQLITQPWQGGILLAMVLGVLICPRVAGAIATILLSLSFSLVLSSQWSRVLPALNSTSFAQSDPLFGQDISFYIFQLPVLELGEFWLSGLFLSTLVAVALVYLLAGNSLSQGRFLGFSPQQQRHLYLLACALLLSTGIGYWLSRYELLYSRQGVTYGASYTDVMVDLPIHTILSFIILGLAIVALIRAWLGSIRRNTSYSLPSFLILITIYLSFSLMGEILLPWVVQRLVVQPNEFKRERPYIERSIAFTRDAFNLTDIQDESFVPQGNLTATKLSDNDLTVRNIRVWDTRPLLESNRQLQQIRSYYEFVDADVDRYTLTKADGTIERRQVLISARELNYERLEDTAKTWVNKHLSYTHGYGFTMSPVNTAAVGGLPDYFIKDIAHVPSNEDVARSIPRGRPRIYFGELTDNYVMTGTRVPELDYPGEDDNVYTTYAGEGGITLGNGWRRLLYAKHLSDWQMLFTNDFTPETKLLFRRNIQDRVKQIAPFLKFDGDPYLVVADANAQAASDHSVPVDAEGNYLYWIIDAYTTSDRYPYSDPGDQPFNYIRNSVKVVVDAYNGSVSFYIADATDPIIQTWAQFFPNMLQPLEAMPPALAAHIRYPEDYSLVQSNQLLVYHMTDPRIFYNREDTWRAPTEIYANESQVVEPYYLIMKLPQEEEEEFILLRPFTPAQRNNLIAWLAARSDGNQYGRILLYRFPKQELVYGPEQIEARINQDPEISQRISLWNTQGSRANQGNLLVIPIEDSLLYVEPLYLEAEQNRLPILARVIVAYQNRIAMGETLEQSLKAIFNPKQSNGPTILRDLEPELLN
ncbi:MAG: COG1615 family transporter [Leptolyngbya sp. SIO3F4]|nr:COG1615 family transporter [Leptolyngbya sp. SIO3F4]